VEELDRGRRHGTVAPGDDDQGVTLPLRGGRKVRRRRALRAGFAEIDVETGGRQQLHALRQVARVRGALPRRRIHDEQRALTHSGNPASHVAGHPQGRSAPFGVLRPAATGLATAFFRLYLLDTLAAGPARPATVLAAIAAERLPFANGAFGRALQSLLDGGYVVPAAQACVALTALGAAERMAERERWTCVLPTLARSARRSGRARRSWAVTSRRIATASRVSPFSHRPDTTPVAASASRRWYAHASTSSCRR